MSAAHFTMATGAATRLRPLYEIDMNSKKLRNLPTSAFPTLDGDAATKKYIDDTAVLKALFDAYTILAADTDDTPAAIALAASQLIGRKASGGIVALAKADVLVIINVEDGADVTDAENVAAAGAIMQTLIAAKGDLIGASADDTPLILTVGTNGKVLVAASGEASGLKWDDVPAHDLGGTIHNADTLANLNSKLSDATLDDAREVCLDPIESDTFVAVADGKMAFTVPAFMNGMNLVDVVASVHTKGVTDTTDIQIRRRRAGVEADMLSTKITIADEYFASDEVIDTDNDDIATGDQIYRDVDAVHSGTAPKGLSLVLTFRKP